MTKQENDHAKTINEKIMKATNTFAKILALIGLPLLIAGAAPCQKVLAPRGGTV